MGVGTRCREGPWSPWILKISAKERCFLNFEWEKTNSTIFGHPWKNFGNTPSTPPGKNPSDAHESKFHSVSYRTWH